MRYITAVTFLILMFPPSVAAQDGDRDSGPQLFAGAAIGWLWDDEGSLGSGAGFGAGVGFRWDGPVAVEVEVGRLSTERRFESGVQFDATLTQLTGRVLYHFAVGNAEPYLGGAVGVTRFERTSIFPVLAPGPGGGPVRQGEEIFRAWHAVASPRGGCHAGSRRSPTRRRVPGRHSGSSCPRSSASPRWLAPGGPPAARCEPIRCSCYATSRQLSTRSSRSKRQIILFAQRRFPDLDEEAIETFEGYGRRSPGCGGGHVPQPTGHSR